MASFVTACDLLKATINSSLDATNADSVTLNYRRKSFLIEKNSPLLIK
jgi:hypothetical protein